MVSHEFATAVSENLPVVVCVFNNGWLGMVRQWQKLFAEKRYSGTELRDNPDFVKLAQAYGADGVHVERSSELQEALRTGIDAGIPFLIDIHMDPEEDVLPMIPPGGNPNAVIRGRCTWK
jgi:acetolactate synthase-1/2/3 large subunit